MYNLNVDGAQTFAVGMGQWVVHNQTIDIPLNDGTVRTVSNYTELFDLWDAGQISPSIRFRGQGSPTTRMLAPHNGIYDFELNAAALNEELRAGILIETIIDKQIETGGNYMVSSSNSLFEAHSYAMRDNPTKPVIYALDLATHPNPAALNGSTAEELAGITTVISHYVLPEDIDYLPIKHMQETATFLEVDPEQILGYVSCQ